MSTPSRRDDRRTLILRCLGRLHPPVDLTELAVWVFVSNARSTTHRSDYERGVSREKTRLHHVDLPELNEEGVLAYDRERRQVVSVDVPPHLRPDV